MELYYDKRGIVLEVPINVLMDNLNSSVKFKEKGKLVYYTIAELCEDSEFFIKLGGSFQRLAFYMISGCPEIKICISNSKPFYYYT